MLNFLSPFREQTPFFIEFKWIVRDIVDFPTERINGEHSVAPIWRQHPHAGEKRTAGGFRHFANVIPSREVIELRCLDANRFRRNDHAAWCV